MKIVTWNLRCVWAGDGINSFLHRVGMIYEKIVTEKPDLIGFQEVIPASLEVLKRLLPEYEFYGQMRSENYDGEGLYTAIRKETTEILGSETFWLSPTPYVAGSRYEEQSPCPRICVYTLIRNKSTSEIMRIYNIHLDHQSEKARALGMDCVLRYMRTQDEKNLYCNILLGDFNAQPDSSVIKKCNDCAALFEATSTITETFHNYGKVKDYKIDYIYASKILQNRLIKADSWKDVHEGIYLSDHYPICIEIENFEK